MLGPERGRDPRTHGRQHLSVRCLLQHRRRHRGRRECDRTMKTFDFRHAVSVDDAIRSVVETGGKYLAGGTNLVDLMKNGVAQPPALVDVRRLGLASVSSTDTGGVRIDSGVSNSALANHPLIRA